MENAAGNWNPNFGAMADVIEFARRQKVQEAWLETIGVEKALKQTWSLAQNARAVCALLHIDVKRENVIAVLRDVQHWSPGSFDLIEYEIALIENSLAFDASGQPV